jgi:phosphatidylserine/phosphatidylglycerophosphate/cardiolipin synthase-like enzyme
MRAEPRESSVDGVSPVEFMNAKRLAKKRMTAAMLDFVAGARRSLVLEGPYYLSPSAITAAFVAARDRGVQLLVLTNRKADPDIAAVVDDMTYFMARAIDRDSSGAMRVLPISNLGALNGGGGRRSNGAPWIIHAKTAVRDHRDVMMSSFNLDQRSYDTDLEAGVVIRNCPGLARELEAHHRQLVRAYADDLRNCDRCKHEPMPMGASPLGYFLGNLF